jgi:hypothetical protein
VLLRASHVSSLFIVVEVKVDVRLLAQTYHRKREESREGDPVSHKLWSALTCQRFGRLRPVAAFRVSNACVRECGVRPPPAKAVTGHRTPN